EISVTRSWRLDPQEIAMLLNVDAVVQARIVKTRFMSDLASYGIDVATHIVNLVTNYYVSPWLTYATRSKEIDAEYSLISKDGGEVLWSISFSEGADWRQPSKVIIDGISRRAARYFPYRK
ncbi:MAG: hypothetical protein HKN76_22495, partial [Saprospiraceae bacterium]|nr:hypothetical protein [Saprospiraceae bacterium]